MVAEATFSDVLLLHCRLLRRYFSVLTVWIPFATVWSILKRKTLTRCKRKTPYN